MYCKISKVRQHFIKDYPVQLHFVEILRRRCWMGKHWEQGAFCTGPVDVWVWSPVPPGARTVTVTDQLGLPSYTSPQGQADSGLLPGSTRNKIKSLTIKLLWYLDQEYLKYNRLFQSEFEVQFSFFKYMYMYIYMYFNIDIMNYQISFFQTIQQNK